MSLVEGCSQLIGRLPHELRGANVREFAAPVPTMQDATSAVVEAFGGTEAGEAGSRDLRP